MLTKPKAINVEKVTWLRDEHGKGIDLSVDAIKNLQDQGISLSEYLEEVKSMNDEKKTPYAGLNAGEIVAKKMRMRAMGQDPELTAYEQLMKAAGIDFKRDTVAKLFEYSDVRNLVAEYISNQIYVGRLRNSIVSETVYASTDIQSTSYKRLHMNDDAGRFTSKIGDDETYPRVKITVSDQDIYLQKYAAMIEVNDRNMKFERLPFVANLIRRIGEQMEIDRMNDVLYAVINGDGNSNTPAKTISGAINTDNVFTLWTKLDMPYKIDKVFLGKANHVTYMTTLSGYADPDKTFNFLGIQPPTVYEWDDTSALGATEILGIDSRYAVEEVTNGPVTVETDRIIDGGLNQTAIHMYSGASVSDNKAVCLWTVS